jgi:hypothetical protein
MITNFTKRTIAFIFRTDITLKMGVINYSKLMAAFYDTARGHNRENEVNRSSPNVCEHLHNHLRPQHKRHSETPDIEAGSSKTSILIYKKTRRYIPEYSPP